MSIASSTAHSGTSVDTVLSWIPPRVHLPPISADVSSFLDMSDAELQRRLLGFIPASPLPSFDAVSEPSADSTFAMRFANLFHPIFRAASVQAASSAWRPFVQASWLNRQVWRSVRDGGWFRFLCYQASRRPESFVSIPNHRVCDEHSEFIRSEVADLLTRGSISDISSVAHQRSDCMRILPLLVVQNSKGKKRLCFDARHLNDEILCPSFKMETIHVPLRLLRPGDWMMTLDLWSGYHQVGLQTYLRPYCCFSWEGRVYRWNVLPFGLSVAPRLFSKVTRALVTKWREEGIRVSSKSGPY